MPTPPGRSGNVPFPPYTQDILRIATILQSYPFIASQGIPPAAQQLGFPPPTAPSPLQTSANAPVPSCKPHQPPPQRASGADGRKFLPW